MCFRTSNHPYPSNHTGPGVPGFAHERAARVQARGAVSASPPSRTSPGTAREWCTLPPLRRVVIRPELLRTAVWWEMVAADTPMPSASALVVLSG